ncbi:TetR/AcrR family transcriptional regulator [Streptomyces sp. NPDC014986]|uniref:TetR/AcrR family transcriptional regulator n=1 Tax=Streptomyces sp. NPDC014986 TaxID=3364934 RepID=UPI0036FA0318
MNHVPELPPRARILQAAAAILSTSGIDGVSIREVCEAAGVTAPTVYHHFGDKKGLFDAVVTEGFERYLAEKRARKPSADPLADLRRGWDGHVEFGLAHPEFYTLMYGSPRMGRQHPAAHEGERILRGLVDRLDDAGLLRVPAEEAVPTIHAATVGTTLILMTDSDSPATKGLSERVREAVLATVAVTGSPSASPDGEPNRTDVAQRAEALLPALAEQSDQVPLSPGEYTLLLELLTRLAGTARRA